MSVCPSVCPSVRLSVSLSRVPHRTMWRPLRRWGWTGTPGTWGRRWTCQRWAWPLWRRPDTGTGRAGSSRASAQTWEQQDSREGKGSNPNYKPLPEYYSLCLHGLCEYGCHRYIQPDVFCLNSGYRTDTDNQRVVYAPFSLDCLHSISLDQAYSTGPQEVACKPKNI